MEFRILGPLEVAEGGHLVRLQAAKLRSLLGILLVRAAKMVSTDELVEALWPERPPATARKLVQIYVSKLRRAGVGDRIVTRSPGYTLVLADEDVLDRNRFEELAVSRPHAGPAEAAERLREGLALWRGPALADFRFEPWAQTEAARLEEGRLAALELRIEADLALGWHNDVVAELDALVADEPLRERLRGQLMLALYRSGRQADALEVYRSGRRVLVDQLGIEPSENLQHLEQAILRQDESLEAAPPAPGRIVDLPRPPRALIGRERVLREIDALLAGDVRLLTLCGAGGSGKTRLALEAAWNALPRFPDGAVFVPLAPVADPALILQTIARSLGLREGGGETLDETLRVFLRARRLLLVLDNLEHLLDAGPPLAALLHEASDVRVLATSRAELRLSIERAYSVPPLALPGRDDFDLQRLQECESVALFVERAGAVSPNFALTTDNAAEVAEICTRLDGLPLAIELAAARLRVLTPTGLLARLERRLPLLSEGERDLPARQQTLTATIDWSHGLLRAYDQEILARVSVFGGAFTIEAAESICAGAENGEVVDAVGRLIEQNLLISSARGAETRFHMLETIREYAHDRLAERGEVDPIRRRLSEYYLGLAEDAERGLRGPQELAWHSVLEAELDNLRAALAYADELADAELALRIAGALGRFWWIHSYLSEGRRWLEDALDWGTDAAPEVRAKALQAVAGLAWNQGDLESAKRFAEEALELYRRVADDSGTMNCLTIFGLIAKDSGDYAQAKRSFTESGELARRLAEPLAAAVALSNLATVAIDEEDYGHARNLLEEALPLSRESGSVRGLAVRLLNLAWVAFELGDHTAAVEYIDECLPMFRELGFRENVAQSHVVLGAVLLAQEEVERSARLLGEADAIHELGGFRVEPHTRRVFTRTVDALRTRLDPATFDREWTAGRQLGLEAARQS
jgi:predicted ATPase/DNA-binding SARP family transcriptional activator